MAVTDSVTAAPADTDCETGWTVIVGAATVVLDVGGLVNLGASTIDGTLDLLNGSGFAAGLFGSGQLVLDTGANVVNLGGGGFAGTITVRSGDVTALPTAFSALIMDGGTAELAGATATGRIVFAPNADATLQLDGTSGPKLGGVIYGFAPGDLIAAFLPQNPGQPQQSDPFYATTLGAGDAPFEGEASATARLGTRLILEVALL